jgi:hypothetical protein
VYSPPCRCLPPFRYVGTQISSKRAAKFLYCARNPTAETSSSNRCILGANHTGKDAKPRRMIHVEHTLILEMLSYEWCDYAVVHVGSLSLCSRSPRRQPRMGIPSQKRAVSAKLVSSAGSRATRLRALGPKVFSRTLTATHELRLRFGRAFRPARRSWFQKTRPGGRRSFPSGCCQDGKPCFTMGA